MLSRKTTKSRDGYTGGTGGVNVSQQKQQNNLHRSGNLISKEKLLHKTENKSRNNERRNPYQQQKYHASSVNPTKSTEREAKHLKTALRRCGDWTEHMSSSKKHYYFDIRTSASQWEKPKDWNDSRAVDVNHQRKPQTKALSSSKPARSERSNHDQTHSASKVNRSLSTSSSSNQTASSGNQQSTTTERSNSNHRLSLSGRVPSHDTSSHNSSSDYNADKDFRSPRNLKDLSGDRDYRLKAMHPGHQRAGTDVDLRGDLYASGQVTPTKNNNSNYHTPGHTPVRVSAPGDKDYRQATPTRPTLTYDATQSGSNGQSLSGFRTLSESSGGDSSAMEKPETGQFYDYSNWNGIRPPPKNNVDVLKQQLSRKGSPHSIDNNLSQHSNDRGMYTSWSGDQNNSSSSRASPATGDFQRHHTAGEITAEVARTITTVLSQAAAASSNNHDHSSSGSNDKLENALQLVLNAVVANKQMKQENDESIDDAADDVAGAKRSRLSTLDDANTTPLHDENNEQQQQQQTTTKPEHPQAVEAATPVEEAAAVNVLSVFTTFHSCRHLVDQSLMQHIASWPSLQHEREAHRLTTECNRCQMALDDIDFDIAQTRSKVREFEIARMLNEQRVHYLRQEMKEISGQSQTPVHTPTNMSSPYSGGNAVISGMSDPYQQLNTTTANNGSMSERGFVDKFPTTTTPSAVPVRPSS